MKGYNGIWTPPPGNYFCNCVKAVVDHLDMGRWDICSFDKCFGVQVFFGKTGGMHSTSYSEGGGGVGLHEHIFWSGR